MFIILQLNHVVCRIAASTMSRLAQTPIVNVIGGYIYTNRGQGVIFMNTIFLISILDSNLPLQEMVLSVILVSCPAYHIRLVNHLFYRKMMVNLLHSTQ